MAVAYGRSSSIALFRPATLVSTGAMNVQSNGHADTEAKITNQGFSYISATAMIALSYAQGRFDAGMEIPENADSETENSAGSIRVSTDYTANADVELTPSAAGISVNFASLAVNVAMANAGSTSNAWIGGLGALNAGTVDVASHRRGVGPRQLCASQRCRAVWSALPPTLCPLKSAPRRRPWCQDVRLTAQSANVYSELNKGKTAVAEAYLGSNGASVGVNMISAVANTAIARANAANHALIDGATLVLSGDFNLYTQGNTYALATVKGENGSLDLAGIGVNVLEAFAEGDFQAVASGNVSARNINIYNNYNSYAEAISAQPSNGVSFSVAGVDTNIANARNNANARAGIGSTTRVVDGRTVLSAAGDFIATGNITITATATARALADIQGVNISVSGSECHRQPRQQRRFRHARGHCRGGNVEGASLSVVSNFNTNGSASNPSSKATVGSNSGASISLVSANANRADAEITATAIANVDGATFNIPGAVQVLNNATSFALADINEPTSANLVNVSVMKVSADAAGVFTASFKAGEGDSTVGSVTVRNTYTVQSNAETGAVAA